jgi:hypothetical protein
MAMMAIVAMIARPMSWRRSNLPPGVRSSRPGESIGGVVMNLRYLSVRVPVMFECTVQTNGYCPAGSAGTW